MYGKKVWIFPDAELPPVGENPIPGHESVIITNTGDQIANIKITLLYTDREPVSFETTVAARRVRCLRTNEEKDFGPYTARFDEQYAIVLENGEITENGKLTDLLVHPDGYLNKLLYIE